MGTGRFAWFVCVPCENVVVWREERSFWEMQWKMYKWTLVQILMLFLIIALTRFNENGREIGVWRRVKYTLSNTITLLTKLLKIHYNVIKAVGLCWNRIETLKFTIKPPRGSRNQTFLWFSWFSCFPWFPWFAWFAWFARFAWKKLPLKHNKTCHSKTFFFFLFSFPFFGGCPKYADPFSCHNLLPPTKGFVSRASHGSLVSWFAWFACFPWFSWFPSTQANKFTSKRRKPSSNLHVKQGFAF